MQQTRRLILNLLNNPRKPVIRKIKTRHLQQKVKKIPAKKAHQQKRVQQIRIQNPIERQKMQIV